MNPLMTFLCVLLVALLGCVVSVPVNNGDEEAHSKSLPLSEKDAALSGGEDDVVKRSDWTGMKAAWGKRGEDDAEFEGELGGIPERQRRGPTTGWQSGLGAWGKRTSANWGQNLRAWGKRTPAEWNNEYIQTLQRQMEAVKNRRASNWQLASWGKRR